MIVHWETTKLGSKLTAETLKRAPKQLALMRIYSQPWGMRPESEISTMFSNTIRKQLRDKGYIRSVLIKEQLNTLSDEILKQPSLKLDDQQQVAMNTIDLHSFNSYY